MVNHSPGSLDATFSALADPTRRAMLGRLAESGCTVSELAEPFRMSLPAISKHLKVLERSGLVRRRVEGRVHHLALQAGPMRNAAEWLEHYRRFWEQSLDRLAAYLAEDVEEEERKENDKK